MKEVATKVRPYALILVTALMVAARAQAQPVTWIPEASAPVPFFEAGGGVLGNYLYCFGADASLNSVAQAFNLTTERWETSTSPPFGQRLYGSAVTNDAIYLITWMGNGPYTYGPEVQKFTPSGGGPTGTWTLMAPYPLRLIAPAVAWDGGNFIYAAGGQDPNPFVQSYKYDIAQNTWTRIADLPEGRGYGGGGAFIKGKFYDLGGVFPPDLLEYDPGHDTWAFRASPPSPVLFGGLCTTTNGNLLFSAGGGGWFFPLYDAVQIYDPLRNEWRLETPLPMLMGCNFARFVPPNKVISAGGVDGSRYLPVTYRGDGFPSSPPTGVANFQPTTFRLLKASPNPFHPTTVISFDLATGCNVRLTVWGTSGRLVATLLESWTHAGTHNITFDGLELAPGIYLAKLEAGESNETQKLVLMK